MKLLGLLGALPGRGEKGGQNQQKGEQELGVGSVQNGQVEVKEALDRLRTLPFVLMQLPRLQMKVRCFESRIDSGR